MGLWTFGYNENKLVKTGQTCIQIVIRNGVGVWLLEQDVNINDNANRILFVM